MQNQLFLRFAKITLVTVYLVVLAGTVVRTTGSGMGCPDWPKCFGKWVPPTNESQLPTNYHEIYKDRGYADTTFNIYHTWTEYLNRLLGALLGIFVFVLFLLSLKFWNTRKVIIYLCGTGVLLTGFQGWLGAVVVSSNLAPFKITIHMLVALIIIALFISIVQKASEKKQPSNRSSTSKIKSILIICIFFTIVQIVIGTKVRERIDTISFSMDYELREKWTALIGDYLDIHRFFAIAVVLLNIYLLRVFDKNSSKTEKVNNYLKLIVALLFIELLLGFILTYYSFPAFAQPVHLLLATIIFGIQFYVWERVRATETERK